MSKVPGLHHQLLLASPASTNTNSDTSTVCSSHPLDVLRRPCMTCCFGSACDICLCSFSHVLGIDGDLLNITAAKELKAAGRLSFKPVATAGDDQQQQQQQQARSQQQLQQVPGPAEQLQQQGHEQQQGQDEEQQQGVCVVEVPDDVDRDRVR